MRIWGAHQGATKAFLTAAHDLFMELTGVLNLVQKREGRGRSGRGKDRSADRPARGGEKKEKNFAEADRIRDELAAHGRDHQGHPSGHPVEPRVKRYE